MDDFAGTPRLFPENSGMLRPTWAPELSAPSAALPGQEHPTVVLCNSIQAFILLLLALPLMHIDSPAVIFQQAIVTEQHNGVLQALTPKTDPYQRARAAAHPAFFPLVFPCGYGRSVPAVTPAACGSTGYRACPCRRSIAEQRWSGPRTAQDTASHTAPTPATPPRPLPPENGRKSRP